MHFYSKHIDTLGISGLGNVLQKPGFLLPKCQPLQSVRVSSVRQNHLAFAFFLVELRITAIQNPHRPEPLFDLLSCAHQVHSA